VRNDQFETRDNEQPQRRTETTKAKKYPKQNQIKSSKPKQNRDPIEEKNPKNRNRKQN
jgi:hypothetical protein